MMLIVGGIASGRRTFARGLGYGPLDCVLGAERMLGGAGPGSDLEALADDMATRPVVIMAEVGLGVVPLDPHERAWREQAGRLACLLAARADCVVRMVAGIPQVLRGRPLRKDGSPWRP